VKHTSLVHAIAIESANGRCDEWEVLKCLGFEGVSPWMAMNEDVNGRCDEWEVLKCLGFEGVSPWMAMNEDGNGMVKHANVTMVKKRRFLLFGV